LDPTTGNLYVAQSNAGYIAQITIVRSKPWTTIPTNHSHMPTLLTTGQPTTQPSRQPSSQPSSKDKPFFFFFLTKPKILHYYHIRLHLPLISLSFDKGQPSQRPTTLYQNVVTYQYTGTVQTYTVPTGVMRIEISAAGASGGGGFNSNVWSKGGLGGYIVTLLSVVPGEVYYVYVGGMGASRTSSYSISHSSGGYNGGGSCNDPGTGEGGGGTDVRRVANDITTRVVVSGGGELIFPKY
jgi:hypothetical protein